MILSGMTKCHICTIQTLLRIHLAFFDLCVYLNVNPFFVNMECLQNYFYHCMQWYTSNNILFNLLLSRRKYSLFVGDVELLRIRWMTCLGCNTYMNTVKGVVVYFRGYILSNKNSSYSFWRKKVFLMLFIYSTWYLWFYLIFCPINCVIATDVSTRKHSPLVNSRLNSSTIGMLWQSYFSTTY